MDSCGDDGRSRRIAPFGNPRITGCLRLPVDYRGLPRPSSPAIAKASVMRLNSLPAKNTSLFPGGPHPEHYARRPQVAWGRTFGLCFCFHLFITSSLSSGFQRASSRLPGKGAAQYACRRLAPLSRDWFLKKEVIQPLVPQRLPCYDFIPVTKLTLGACLLAVGPATSGEVGFHDVTGGVYKARERIQGIVADTPLLAIPASCSRVAGCNPNWGGFWRFAASRDAAAHCTRHCSTFAAPGVRAIRT